MDFGPFDRGANRCPVSLGAIVRGNSCSARSWARSNPKGMRRNQLDRVCDSSALLWRWRIMGGRSPRTDFRDSVFFPRHFDLSDAFAARFDNLCLFLVMEKASL